MIAAVLFLHLLIGLVIVCIGDQVGRRGFAAAAIAPVATLMWLAVVAPGVIDGDPVDQSVNWVTGLDLAFDFSLDAFGVIMVGLVSGIGVLVCVYALGYFSKDKPGTARLAGLLTLFAGAMLGVVLSDNLLGLFVFWELTSITSFLLIGDDDRDERARSAALSALLITGAGGLVMLAGFVIIGEAAGTYRLSELATNPPTGGAVGAGLVCVLIGAFTKSAQAPFSGWLPGAMVAPTPISTYLHAATMVKAGVYLVAILAPLFADSGSWRLLVGVVGATTMIIGGWRALRQHDLKLLLAYGTISQLGFMMMLLGTGDYAMAQAGVVLLIAHGIFKAALFMVVGMVDHQCGTRDVRRLHDLGPSWRPVMLVAVVSAASMAGLPPLLGFIAKEKALDAVVDGDFSGALALTIAIVAGSILTVAYSGRLVLGLLGRLGDDSVRAEHPIATDVAAPSIGFAWPAGLLAVLTVCLGVAPMVLDDVVAAATLALYPDSEPAHLALWHGPNLALGLSAIIIAAGAVLIVARGSVTGSQSRFHSAIAAIPTSEQTFWAIVRETSRGAARTTSLLQNGSLPIYLTIILGVAAAAPLIPAIGQLDAWPDVVDTPIHIPLAALIVGAALGATLVHRRIAAALMLGAVGYAMAGFYVVQGAPDLALTQFAIETLATVLFVLVLRFLPPSFYDVSRAVTMPIRLAVSGLVGFSVFVLAIVASGARSDVSQPNVSGEMIARSVPDANGSNVVNVILVDFRGLDTVGEITVLVVAALGMVGLARVARQSGWIADAVKPDVGFARLPVVDGMSRLLFPGIVVLSVYLLFAGHNQPGGGFVGGLTAGAAISLRYIAGGTDAVRSTFRLKPWTILGGGLLIAVTTAIVPALMGRSVLEHGLWEQSIPLLDKVKVTSALAFDIGVYTVVVGLVLMAFEAFGDEAAAESDPSDTDGSDDKPVDHPGGVLAQSVGSEPS